MSLLLHIKKLPTWSYHFKEGYHGPGSSVSISPVSFSSASISSVSVFLCCLEFQKGNDGGKFKCRYGNPSSVIETRRSDMSHLLVIPLQKISILGPNQVNALLDFSLSWKFLSWKWKADNKCHRSQVLGLWDLWGLWNHSWNVFTCHHTLKISKRIDHVTPPSPDFPFPFQKQRRNGKDQRKVGHDLIALGGVQCTW